MATVLTYELTFVRKDGDVTFLSCDGSNQVNKPEPMPLAFFLFLGIALRKLLREGNELRMSVLSETSAKENPLPVFPPAGDAWLGLIPRS